MSEHLCTVIQQNEVRKAKKLSELLQALNVESPDSSVVMPVLFQKTPTPGLDIWPSHSPKVHRKTDGVKDGQVGNEAETASPKGQACPTRTEKVDVKEGVSDPEISLANGKVKELQLATTKGHPEVEATPVGRPLSSVTADLNITETSGTRVASDGHKQQSLVPSATTDGQEHVPASSEALSGNNSFTAQPPEFEKATPGVSGSGVPINDVSVLGIGTEKTQDSPSVKGEHSSWSGLSSDSNDGAQKDVGMTHQSTE